MPLHRRVPKRGFFNLFRVEYAVVNLDALARAVRRRHGGHPRAAARAGAGEGRGEQPVKVLGARRHREGADGSRPQVQRQGRREDRGRGRHGRGDPAAGSPRRRTGRGTEWQLPWLKACRNIFAVPDLRKRVLFTLALLGGLPGRQPHPDAGREHRRRWRCWPSRPRTTMFGLYDMFSGGNLSKVTIFALGIMPYISASIILQLLTVVWPYLERLSKEGELGRRKITQYTRYGTILLSVIQSLGHRDLPRAARPTSPAACRWSTTRAGASALMTVLTLTTGHDVHHVARRADHRARHRQRHVADHLRGDRRRPAARGPRDVRPDAHGPDGPDPDPAADRASWWSSSPRSSSSSAATGA